MDIAHLPDYFLSGPKGDLHLYDYTATGECTHQKVKLGLNTFSFLLEGTKEVNIGQSLVSIENTHFIGMTTGHCLMTERHAQGKANYRSLLLFFSNEKVLELCRKHDIKPDGLAPKPAALVFAKDPFLYEFVNGLLALSSLSEKVKQQLLALKFEELMLYLVNQHGPSALLTFAVDLRDHEQHLLQVVENNKLNRLTLTQLAFLCNMSLSTFKREFEKQFGSSPSKWFQEQRLAHAAFLLRSKSSRPSDLYESAGYENLSNFTNAFKARFGKTPRQYQELSF